MAAYGAVLLLSLLLCSDCDKIVREGADVTIPCGGVELPQPLCTRTSWQFVPAKNDFELELFIQGERLAGVSDRLSLTEDCGLKIQHVLPVEAGVYHCGQSNPPHISSLPVSVVVVTEEVEPLGSKFRCEAVSSRIVVIVRWLHQGRELNQSDPKLMINSHGKNTALWVPRDHPLYRDKNQLKCEVEQEEEIHVFSLIQKTPEPSGLFTDVPTHFEPPDLFTDDTTHFDLDVTPTQTNQGGTSEGQTQETRPKRPDRRQDMKVRYAVVCFLLIALLLCLSVTLVWTHSSGCRFLRGQNNEEVFYENIRESSTSDRLHRRMAK